jgi:hypothetical protein
VRAASGAGIAVLPDLRLEVIPDSFHRGKRRRKELAMRSSVRFLVVAASVLLLATATSAQTVQVGKDMSLTIKGFISATAFAQDQSTVFGNGQNAEFPAGAQCEIDCWFGGGDIRNTRLTLVFDGPKIGSDWKAGGTVEMDFFGGFGSSTNSAFVDQQPVPRLRLGFLQISNGSTTIQLGQQWSPLFGNVAVSLSHIAFPLGYGSAGDVGWRFPGLFINQKLTDKDSAVQASVAAAVMSGSWNGPGCDTTTNCVNYLTAGNTSWPQFELRFNLGGKMGDSSTWSTYIVGHVDEKDLSGAGASGCGTPNPCGPNAPSDKLTGSAVEIGAKFQIGPVLIQGNGYDGLAIGQQFAAITQFGKIRSVGGWAQIGFDFTKNWSVFGFWGIDDPKNSDVALWVSPTAGRMKNMQYAGMLRWRSGPLAFGFEYIYDKLSVGLLEIKRHSTQLALSGLYNF